MLHTTHCSQPNDPDLAALPVPACPHSPTEARCEAAERKLQMAQERSARLDSEARDLKVGMRDRYI